MGSVTIDKKVRAQVWLAGLLSSFFCSATDSLHDQRHITYLAHASGFLSCHHWLVLRLNSVTVSAKVWSQVD